MEPRTSVRRTRLLGRRALALTTAVALTFGGVAAVAPATASAAVGDPLVGACLQIDDDSLALKLADSDITDGLTDLLGELIDGLDLATRAAFDLLGFSIDDIIERLTGATITFTDPESGDDFQVIDVDLNDGVIDAAELAQINLPDGVTDFTYQIVPNGLTGVLGGLLNPILGTSSGVNGSASCGGTLPLAGITGSYFALNPARVLDTRNGTGTIQRAIPARSAISVQMTGNGGVPASGVAAVSITVTATKGGAAGFISVYPSGTTRPASSNLNYAKGQDVANSAIATVGSNGRVAFYNGSNESVELIADVSGYYVSNLTPLLPLLPGAYQPVSADRIFDSRTAASGSFDEGETRSIQITGRANVPAGASSVVLNLTATNTKTTGYLSAYPTGIARPYVSSLNFNATRTVANQVVVPIGDNGKINVYYEGIVDKSVDAIVDVVGYFTGGLLPAQTQGLQEGVDPVRLLDTRTANGVSTTTKVPAKGTVTVQLAGRGGIPSSFVRSVLLTVTATQGKAIGFVTIYPSGATRPNASVLNFTTRNVANQVMAAVGADGKIKLYNGSALPVHLVLDATGYVNGSTLSVG